MRSIRFILVLIIIGCFVLFYSIGYTQRDENEIFENSSLFTKVFIKIKRNYVEDVQTRDLFNGAINGMLTTLDPYSDFLTPEVFREMKVETSGNFGGIGIEVTKKKPVDQSPIHVITPMLGTPAYEAGIMAGDDITKIEEKSTYEMSLNKAVSLMRGKPGTTIKITVHKKDTDKEVEMELKREIIHIESVKFVRFLDADTGIGYIKLETFAENSASELKDAVNQLLDHGMKGLILDLRFNPGGLLESAVDVSDLFLDSGLIVATMTRDNAPQVLKNQNNRMLSAKKETTVADFPMIIMINKASASASEIVAGALKDHHRAVLVGENTFGKGSVQTLFQINKGREMYALKLTTANYYTPSGYRKKPRISIANKGIEPDIKVELTREQFADLFKARQQDWIEYNKARTGSDSAKDFLKKSFPPNPKDIQLIEALRILKKNLTLGKTKLKQAA